MNLLFGLFLLKAVYLNAMGIPTLETITEQVNTIYAAHEEEFAEEISKMHELTTVDEINQRPMCWFLSFKMAYYLRLHRYPVWVNHAKRHGTVGMLIHSPIYPFDLEEIVIDPSYRQVFLPLRVPSIRSHSSEELAQLFKQFNLPKVLVIPLKDVKMFYDDLMAKDTRVTPFWGFQEILWKPGDKRTNLAFEDFYQRLYKVSTKEIFQTVDSWADHDRRERVLKIMLPEKNLYKPVLLARTKAVFQKRGSR